MAWALFQVSEYDLCTLRLRAWGFIHEHFHPQEEVYEVIEGEIELTIDGVTEIVRPGLVGIVPGNVRHSVKALTDGRAIIVDYPVRSDFH